MCRWASYAGPQSRRASVTSRPPLRSVPPPRRISNHASLIEKVLFQARESDGPKLLTLHLLNIGRRGLESGLPFKPV